MIEWISRKRSRPQHNRVGEDHGWGGKLIWVSSLMVIFVGFFESQQPWLAWLLLGLVLERLVRLHQWRLLGIALCCSGLLVGRLAWSEQRQQQVPETTQQLYFKADQIKLNGDQLTGSAQTPAGCRVFALVKIPQAAVKQALAANSAGIVVDLTATRAERLAPAPNQAQFDFARWGRHRDLIWQVSGTLQTWQPRPPTNLSEWIGCKRAALLSYFAKYPRYCRFHLRMLVTGYSDRLDRPLQELLSAWGLVHLFALSGFHVNLLVRGCRWLAARCHCPDELVCGLLLILLPLYGLFVGGQIGIIRAILSFQLRCWQRWRRRYWPPLDLFAVNLLICLLLKPSCLFELGPQLSFGLTLLLIIIPAKTSYWRLQLRLSGVTGLILIAQTGVWSWWALLGSFLLAPLFSGLILPSVLLTWLWPATSALWEPCWRLLYAGLAWCTQLFSGRLVVGKPASWVVLLALVLLLLQGEAPRLVPSLLAPAAGLLCVNCLLIKCPLVDRVTLIDVGQGDSILVQTAWPRRTLLIDTGGRLGFQRAGWQQRQTTAGALQTTLPYLQAAGIQRLDYLLLTHQDADHLGDLVELVQQMPAKTLLLPAGMAANPQVQAKLRQLQCRPQIRSCLADDQLQDQRLQGRFLAPTKPGLGTNEDSLVLLLRLGKIQWLFTGDLDQTNELKICQRYPQLRADYLKVGHHGSQTSSHPRFLAQLQLRGAFISAGRANRYHHPALATLARLRAANIPFMNTARYGMIEWSQDPWGHQRIQTKLTGSEGIRGQDGNENDQPRTTTENDTGGFTTSDPSSRARTGALTTDPNVFRSTLDP
ncbi:DNA internalization-related competence protein ComEC/Rec2 [Lapidilactobacillus salsurivasis]